MESEAVKEAQKGMYATVLNSIGFLTEINELADVRATIQNTIIDCRTQNQRVLQLINNEFGW